jgi:hypothetical protein
MPRTDYKQLEDLAQNAIPGLLNSLVYEDNGNYVMYEQYYIGKTGEDYHVYRYRDEYCIRFNRLRNAATWCTLDHYNKYYEANRVIYLDKKLESLEVDKHIHQKHKQKGDWDRYEIAAVKYQHDCHSQRIFRGELDKYIILAKSCQQRGFENELTRTSRKQKEQAS